MTIGAVTAPHGVRGEVRVLPLTDFPEAFLRPRARLSLLRRGAVRASRRECEIPHRGACSSSNWRVSATAIKQRGCASVEVQVPREEAVPLPPGRYYIFELMGARVVTVDGTALGILKDVLTTAANDVYVVEGERRRGRSSSPPSPMLSSRSTCNKARSWSILLSACWRGRRGDRCADALSGDVWGAGTRASSSGLESRASSPCGCGTSGSTPRIGIGPSTTRRMGAGPGWSMKPEPVYRALQAAIESSPDAVRGVILMSPQGRRFEQRIAWELAGEERLILICGHYEGVDERVRTLMATDEISIGDYVLTGGELPAMVVIDAVISPDSGRARQRRVGQYDSFSDGLLEYPHYTRPREFLGESVPEILLSGNHQAIAGGGARSRSEDKLAPARFVGRRSPLPLKISSCSRRSKTRSAPGERPEKGREGFRCRSSSRVIEYRRVCDKRRLIRWT